MMKKLLMAGALVTAVAAGNAFAHFPIWIPDNPLAQPGYSVGGSVSMMFVSGHPYEQEYAPTEQPEKVTVIFPDGNTEDLTGQVTNGTYQVDGLQANVWKVNFTPPVPGDSILAVDGHEEFGLNDTIYQEYIKTIVHVEEQGGWDNRSGQPVEIVPLTRPYGLEEGFVFTGQLLKGDEPLAGVTVFIEEFLHHVPRLEDLPPEPFITKEVKTDPNGVFTTTLPNAAWWIIAAEVENIGEETINGRTYTRNGLAALWVHVAERFVQQFPAKVANWRNR